MPERVMGPAPYFPSIEKKYGHDVVALHQQTGSVTHAMGKGRPGNSPG